MSRASPAGSMLASEASLHTHTSFPTACGLRSGCGHGALSVTACTAEDVGPTDLRLCGDSPGQLSWSREGSGDAQRGPLRRPWGAKNRGPTYRAVDEP